MSQEDILKILVELGGEATTNQVREVAKKKFPKRTLYTYVLTRLKQLEKHSQIKRIGQVWRIS
jgi:hypothetical protein